MTDLPERLADAFRLIRDVPDYPTPGVLFRDITPVLADPTAFGTVVEAMAEHARSADVVVVVEARGFLVGAAVAVAAGVGVVPVRKAGKLPRVAARRDYELEYGTATLELPEGCIEPGARAYVVDDVLATGGTLRASCELIEQVGATVTGIGVLLELTALAGRDRLPGRSVHSLLEG
ncbi:adenine phosphoribosyltransferase [Pseudonocardia spinosispora]|uniref:adenine phosphoribosyltransferase n=1 Tax=Pseudonocardia spinosispora TaxID=103441 RepID=UPI0004056BE2|nr:adenine phosphoribosyltransferase [Pseudonocardia spinosispora]